MRSVPLVNRALDQIAGIWAAMEKGIAQLRASQRTLLIKVGARRAYVSDWIRSHFLLNSGQFRRAGCAMAACGA